MKYFVEEKEITEQEATELLGGKKWFNNYMRVAMGILNCGFKTHKIIVARNQVLTITK